MVAKKANKFEPEFYLALDNLSKLFHGSSTSNWLVVGATKIGKTKLESTRREGKAFPNGVFGLGTRMSIPDFQNTKRFVKHLPYEPHEVADETLLSLAEEMERRLQGQIFIAAFEFTEQYLKEVARTALFQFRGNGKKTIIPFHKKAFHKKQTKWQSPGSKGKIGTPLYFDAYVQAMYQNGMSDFLRQLRIGLPTTIDAEKFVYYMEICESKYREMEFCRHQLVHAFGVCNPNRLKKLPEDLQASVNKMTATSQLTGEKTILPNSRQVMDWISLMAGLVLHVHRGVSDVCDMEPCM